MTRQAEAALIALAAALAGGGVALAGTGGRAAVDAMIAATVIGVTYGSLHIAERRWAPSAVPYLVPLAALLTTIGLVEIHSLDRDLGRLQQWWLLVGGAIAVGTLAVLRDRGVEVLRRFRYLFLFAAIVLLLLPLLPSSLPVRGVTLNGSRLWIRASAGGTTLSFQPGEAAKVLIVAFLAAYLAERRRSMSVMGRRFGPIRFPEPRHLVPVVLAFGAAFAVLVYQRDLGASLLLFAVFAAMLYAATNRAFYPAMTLLLGVAGAIGAHKAFAHVQTRVAAWLNPFDDFTGSGFQAAQGLFALGSGGIVGTGLGAGHPDLVPAAATDYIYAAIAEETGLAGGLAVIAMFALLVTIAFGIGLRARDPFRRLLATGLALVFGIQTFLILAGVLRVMPVTGITLPLVSYGGSSLLANLVAVALLLRVSHEERG